jgi:hypothetical protein
MDYELNFVLTYKSNKKDDTYSAIVVAKQDYDNLIDALNDQDLDRASECLDGTEYIDMVASDVSKEELNYLVQDYSDNHLVTVQLQLPDFI